MRKFISALLLALSMALAGLVITTPAEAQFDPQLTAQMTVGLNGAVHSNLPAKVQVTQPYNGILFGGGNPCFDNDIGTTWPIMTAAAYFEAGGLVISESGECTSYPSHMIARFSVYNAVDQSCGKVTGPLISDGLGGYYWNGNVQVQMNAYYTQCYDTQQNKNNRVSQMIGYALGLAIYFHPSEVCIMNRTFENTYNFAGVCDRNRIAAKY